MKKKSTSKLAFFSLRVLPGLVAAAFIAFALARSDAVGDTLVCGNVTTSNCSNPTMTVNVCAHDGSPLVTDIYLKDNARRPVLVLRGCEARCGITAQVLQTIWPPNATYDLVVQDIRGSPFVTKGHSSEICSTNLTKTTVTPSSSTSISRRGRKGPTGASR